MESFRQAADGELATRPETENPSEDAGCRGQRGVGEAPVLAAVDLGSNNCRLLIARPEGWNFTVVDAFSRVVRLGEGVPSTGVLDADAMRRSVAALSIIANKIRRGGVTRSRVVATEACRRATNISEFRDRVRLHTGLRLEVIDYVEEARLSLMGCAPLLDPDTPYALVFDIGGGSTEITWLCSGRGQGLEPRLIDTISLPFGVVSLSEEQGADRPAFYRAIVRRVVDSLAAFDRRHGISGLLGAGSVQMLGSSGTVTTLASVVLDLPCYDRSVVDGCLLDRRAALAACARLRDLSPEGRALQSGIGRSRSELVVVGCAVFEGICRAWAVDRLRVADRGVREGILFDLMASWRRNGLAGRG